MEKPQHRTRNVPQSSISYLSPVNDTENKEVFLLKSQLFLGQLRPAIHYIAIQIANPWDTLISICWNKTYSSINLTPWTKGICISPNAVSRFLVKLDCSNDQEGEAGTLAANFHVQKDETKTSLNCELLYTISRKGQIIKDDVSLNKFNLIWDTSKKYPVVIGSLSKYIKPRIFFPNIAGTVVLVDETSRSKRLMQPASHNHMDSSLAADSTMRMIGFEDIFGAPLSNYSSREIFINEKLLLRSNVDAGLVKIYALVPMDATDCTVVEIPRGIEIKHIERLTNKQRNKFVIDIQISPAVADESGVQKIIKFQIGDTKYSLKLICWNEGNGVIIHSIKNELINLIESDSQLYIPFEYSGIGTIYWTIASTITQPLYEFEANSDSTELGGLTFNLSLEDIELIKTGRGIRLFASVSDGITKSFFIKKNQNKYSSGMSL